MSPESERASFIESLVLSFFGRLQNGKSAKIVLCVIRQILLNLIFNGRQTLPFDLYQREKGAKNEYGQDRYPPR